MQRILHVDVFGTTRFAGNPLAVMVGDHTLSTERMQMIANWLNLSESTFVEVLTPTSYRVRIFTPKSELPFAGHPSIGTAAALMYAGLLDPSALQFTQHCGAGDLPVRRSSAAADADWFVQAPVATMLALDDLAIAELALAVGQQANKNYIRPVVINNGPCWAVAEYESPELLLAMTPDLPALAAWNTRYHNLGLAAFARQQGGNKQADAEHTDDHQANIGNHMEVRCFVPIDGIAEDPVTGSGNAAVAAALDLQNGFADLPRQYTARQGRAVGRDGVVQVHIDAHHRVAIGGSVRLIAEGALHLVDS
jgi:PhzF family phenazine biosynthesis protein